MSELVYANGSPRINRINQEKQVIVTYRFDSDVEESKMYLEAARASVEGRYSWGTYAASLVRQYRKLLRGEPLTQRPEPQTKEFA